MSYLKDRLKKLNITEKLNTYKAIGEDGVHSMNFKFFTENDKGDIIINYIHIDGHVATYLKDGKKTRAFSRTRYQAPVELPDGKTKRYDQPPKSPIHAFVTPELLSRYKKGEETKDLYIVEGEFKAFSMSNFGLPTFGIGGIHNYVGGEKKADIIQDIVLFCEKCKVQNIIFLFDADCMLIKWKEGKDVSQRPAGFYSALNNFNELLKPRNINLYFSHVIYDEDHEDLKGIDDVLYGISDHKLVVEELQAFSKPMRDRKYILSYLITGKSSFYIKDIFGLNKVEDFYKRYEKELEGKEFCFKGNYYVVDSAGNVNISWRGQDKQYVRIGTEYYKITYRLMSDDQIEEDLQLWSKGTISDDYRKSKIFLDSIEKFDDFTNYPENDPDKYKRTVIVGRDGKVSRLYNRYSKVPHVPEPGSWTNINVLLHHLFDYRNLKNESLYEFALDYLQLLYTKPLKHLPILCLVSKERGTGKTTFLNLLKAIFSDNMRILDSDRLMSRFNGSWAGKLVVAVDESFLDMNEKNGAGNKVKMIATNATIPFEDKHKPAREVPNISKLIMCSNDEYNFVKIDKEENRYCVVKVSPFHGSCDPHMIDKMIGEIPAFLYFLKNRQLYYPERSRLWFDESIFFTEALQKIQERTEPMKAKQIKYAILNQFHWLRSESVKLSANVLFELVKQNYSHIYLSDVKEWLMDNGYRTKNASKFYYKMKADYEPQTSTERYYTFFAKDFMSHADLEEFRKEGWVNPDNGF